ncbi:hypothetical protein OBBRIDRAFT_796201 [Obba rivulosa]|uniref:PH domain-containing protein n=1 Tax=Obba rivulosa TaxID=1052685 RepID=A0A8E2DHT1_9APHY|nr:hypothetical protein OBBRIDRAFT_796201 [Obba rivulosa]
MSTPLPLRDRRQSQSTSPDPPDGAPWPTPHTTTPLRIAKRDSPLPTRGGAQLDRRQSSSYRHMKNNNLVSKSPFRSQIPTPSRPSAPPSPRKVSGEKRPRSTSFLSQAENERPQGFKRRQSKAYLGLAQKEPVTKSPFRQTTVQQQYTGDEPVPPLPPKHRKTSPLRRVPASPGRPSLVTKRLHGPRTVSGGSNASNRRRRRKTVTFDERCDVLEFDVEDEEMDEFPFDSDDDGGEDAEDDQEEGSFQEVSLDDDASPGDTLAGTVDSVLREAANSEETCGNLGSMSPPLDAVYPLLQPDRSPASRHTSSFRDPDVSDSVDVFTTPSHSRMSTPMSTPPTHTQLVQPPPKHSTHAARAVDHGGHNWDEDVQMLPPSPSPAKTRPASIGIEREDDAPMPKFMLDMSGATADVVGGSSEDPFGLPSATAQNHYAQRELGGRTSLAHNDSPHHFHTHLADRERGSPMSSKERSERGVMHPHMHAAPLPISLLDRIDRLDRSPTATPVNSPNFEQDSAPGVMAFQTPPTSAGEGSPDAKRLSSGHESPHVDGSTYGDVFQDEDLDGDRGGDEEGDEEDANTTQPLSEDTSLIHREEIQGKGGRQEKGLEEGARKPVELPRLTRQNPTFDGVMSLDPEPQPRDPPRPSTVARASTADNIEPLRAFDAKADVNGAVAVSPARSSLALGDMSALDRLVESVLNGGPGEGDGASFAPGTETTVAGRVERLEPVSGSVRGPQRVQMGSSFAGERDSRSADLSAATSGAPPPLPPKDAIRAREELIRQKKREARRREMEEDMDMDEEMEVREVRPRRRRSLSTGDAQGGGRAAAMAQAMEARKRAAMSMMVNSDGLLDVIPGADDRLSDSIDRELRKLDGPSHGRYHVREHSETIYASADVERVAHVGDAGDVDAGKAWRAVKRPSDMNEYSKQLKELRAQDKTGKAQGKVFVRVIGLKNLNVPLPQQPTIISCTLNNGIHYVSTPPSRLSQSCSIEQEFELIEHSKLEFTLTIKARRDPHIMAQVEANNPPRPAPPQPAPVPPSKGGGMRHFFFGGSPKKVTKIAPRPMTPPVVTKQPENLARYLKNDGTLGRAFVSFKDIAQRCDTKLFETSYPLIGQKNEWGAAPKTVQVGEIILQMFRLPALPGVPPDQLPQSLEECHRGLRHMNWHKVTYFEGTLTQSGGDCITWRRRHLRVIGANLVAFNDVTKKAIATVDLKKALAVEDDQEALANARTPQLGKAPQTLFTDDYDCPYPADRSFRLIFPQKQQIVFFADTDEEKAKWLDVLRALVGRIPPYPLWAELVWQRQQELAKNARQPGPSAQSVSTS